MSLKYIRNYYHVPAKRGGKVKFYFAGNWHTGRITSADHHLRVAPDDLPIRRLIFHPEDVTYLAEVTA
jgi:hypothetical protein